MPANFPTRLISYLLLVFFSVACCRDTDLKINPALKSSWLPYPPLAKIKYLGPDNDTLTFTAQVRNYEQEATDKACGTYQISMAEVTLTTSADPAMQLIFSLSHEIVLNLKIRNVPAKVTGLEAKFNLVSEEYITHAWRDTFTKDKTINGRPYQQVLVVYGNQTPGKLNISEILYAADIGLLAFKTFAGGWYYKI